MWALCVLISLPKRSENLKTERLQKWTLISETVGAIAIVLSLMVVAYELRRNTEASYANTLDSLSESQMNWRSNILSTPGLLEAWSQEIGVELDAGWFIGEQLLLIYERAFFAHKYERYRQLN